MNLPLRQRLVLYQYIAGISDTAAGLFLLIFPIVTLRAMGLGIVPPRAFVRYIGVFVFCVGLTYIWTLIRWPLNEHDVPVWLTQWKITALIRSLVAICIVSQIMAQELESRWLAVALFDGVFGAIQYIGLDQGWIERSV